MGKSHVLTHWQTLLSAFPLTHFAKPRHQFKSPAADSFHSPRHARMFTEQKSMTWQCKGVVHLLRSTCLTVLERNTSCSWQKKNTVRTIRQQAHFLEQMNGSHHHRATWTAFSVIHSKHTVYVAGLSEAFLPMQGRVTTVAVSNQSSVE